MLFFHVNLKILPVFEINHIFMATMCYTLGKV